MKGGGHLLRQRRWTADKIEEREQVDITFRTQNICMYCILLKSNMVGQHRDDKVDPGEEHIKNRT
jgi:hypothetical protein